MKRAAHISLQGIVDYFVLLYPTLAAKGFGFNLGGVVIAIATQITIWAAPIK